MTNSAIARVIKSSVLFMVFPSSLNDPPLMAYAI
jgi:hypothetical protein